MEEIDLEKLDTSMLAYIYVRFYKFRTIGKPWTQTCLSIDLRVYRVY